MQNAFNHKKGNNLVSSCYF